MKPIAAALAVLSTAWTTTVSAETIDCLAYLAADAEFTKAVHLYREAEQSTSARTVRDEAIRAATEVRNRVVNEAEHVRIQARDAAHKARREAIESAEDALQREVDARRKTAQNNLRAAKAVEMTRYQTLVDASAVRPPDKGAEDIARAAYQQAKQDGIDVGRQLRKLDLAAFPQKNPATEAEYQRAIKSADHSYRKAREAAEATHSRAVEAAEQVYQQARAQAVAVARPAYEAARERAVDAYMSAYANPGPGLYRNVEGYGKVLVLKMAIAEREFCPQ